MYRQVMYLLMLTRLRAFVRAYIRRYVFKYVYVCMYVHEIHIIPLRS